MVCHNEEPRSRHGWANEGAAASLPSLGVPWDLDPLPAPPALGTPAPGCPSHCPAPHGTGQAGRGHGVSCSTGYGNGALGTCFLTGTKYSPGLPRWDQTPNLIFLSREEGIISYIKTDYH